MDAETEAAEAPPAENCQGVLSNCRGIPVVRIRKGVPEPPWELLPGWLDLCSRCAAIAFSVHKIYPEDGPNPVRIAMFWQLPSRQTCPVDSSIEA